MLPIGHKRLTNMNSGQQIDWESINELTIKYYSIPTKTARYQWWIELTKQCTTKEQYKQLEFEFSLIPYAWDVYCRDKQNLLKQLQVAGAETIAFIGGRGAGKTLSASKLIRDAIYGRIVEQKHDILIFGPTNDDVKKIMFDGDSGIDKMFPPCHKPVYTTVGSKIKFHTGNVAYLKTAEVANKARGSNTGLLIMDEIAAYPQNQLFELYNNAMASLRKLPGLCAITTTPRSNGVYGQFFRQLVDESKKPNSKTIIVHSKTMENAHNLVNVEHRYEQFAGTVYGKEEFDAEFLFDTSEQLFDEKVLLNNCISSIDNQNYTSIVISIDPATTVSAKSDETGIIAVGFSPATNSQPLWQINVLNDMSGQHTPEKTSQIVLELWKKWSSKCNNMSIVYESNQGGDYIKNALVTMARSMNLNWHLIQSSIEAIHSSIGKADRARPVSQLVASNRIKFGPNQIALIKQLSQFTGFNQRHAADDKVDAFCQGINKIVYQMKQQPQRDISNMPRLR